MLYLNHPIIRGDLLYDESQIAASEFKKWKIGIVIYFLIPLIVGILLSLFGLFLFTFFSTLLVAIGLFETYMGIHGLLMNYKAEPLKIYSQGIKFISKPLGLFVKSDDDNFEQFSTIQKIFIHDRGNDIVLYRKDGTKTLYFVLDIKRFVDIAKNFVYLEFHKNYKCR